MKRVNMHDAKTHLSRYVSGLSTDSAHNAARCGGESVIRVNARSRAGRCALEGKESLILSNRNRPVAELRPLPPKAGKPRIGVAKGEFVVPEAFFEPLPDEILKAFGRKKSS